MAIAPRSRPVDAPAVGRWAVLLGVLAIGLVGIACVAAQFSDGSLYQYVIIKRQHVMLGSSRQEAHLIMQGPLWVGVKAGITSMSMLNVLFGLGLIGIPTLCWLGALWLERTTP
jgi:hypothetical protein